MYSSSESLMFFWDSGENLLAGFEIVMSLEIFRFSLRVIYFVDNMYMIWFTKVEICKEFIFYLGASTGKQSGKHWMVN